LDGFFPRLGNAVARYRWLVIGLWAAALVAAVPGVRNVSKALVTGGYEIPDSDSGHGTTILEEEFGRRTVTTAVLIFTSDRVTLEDPNDPTFRDAVNRSADRVSKMDGVKDVVSFFSSGARRFVSADAKTTYVVIDFSVDEERATEMTPEVRAEVEDQPPGIKVHLLGFPAISYDISEDSDKDLNKAETVSMPVALLLLLLVFGTVVAAGLPLILGAFAVGISYACIYLFALHFETSIFAKNVASMIGLGLGIDFSLLMVSRFREELDKGISVHDATRNTVMTSGRSIVFSGLTVMLGLSVLCLYKLTLIRSIALGMLIVAAIAMVGAVTLLPALMAVFGRKINAFSIIPGWNKRRQASHEGEGKWHRWSMLVMRSPWVFLIITASILLALAYPAREINAIGTGSARTMPEDSKSRAGFEALREGFGPGEAAPIQILLRSRRDGGAWDPATLEGVYQLVKKIQADPRVERVESLLDLANAAVPNISEAQFKTITQQQVQADPRGAAYLPSLVNVNGRADTHSIVVISKEDELGADSINLVKELRATIIPSIPALRADTWTDRCTNSEPAECTGIFVAGETAQTLDYRDALLDQFPMLVGLVLLVTYLVLVLFFHSLILPLKAILLNVIAILASYGVLVLVFQHGVGEDLLNFEHDGRLSMFSPVILFSILFGLSTDYEVFLLSRVKEIYAHTHDNDRSVAMGLERTAGIITAAGLIMIVVFGSFALGTTLVIKELGIGLAVAVLLDSTIIRIILVPASMKLMGDGNWWMPKFLDWIPTIEESVELPAPSGALARPRDATAVLGPHVAAGVRPCPVCQTPLRPTARFCGRCGKRLEEVRLQPPAVNLQSGGNVRRVPVMLTNGRQHLKAWLVLRDCQVEDNPRREGVPLLQIDGLDLAGLSGAEPEIQIRNARIRL
jgi:putative drug exporter of the RND superfamily